MLKKNTKSFALPVVTYFLKIVFPLSKTIKRHTLFDGDDGLFKKIVRKESIYAEYGCGASTVWVAENIGCEVFSVDSSTEWIDKVKKSCESFEKINLHYVDVGPVGSWGRPIGYQKSENFNDYTDWIWTNERSPNVILVDGRFRVCCFLTCLIYGESGAKILFDDYTNRPNYHFVERYLKPTETCGRQALFVIPEKESLNIDGIVEDINKFRFVFD
jgi:hypothetical protein